MINHNVLLPVLDRHRKNKIVNLKGAKILIKL